MAIPALIGCFLAKPSFKAGVVDSAQVGAALAQGS